MPKMAAFQQYPSATLPSLSTTHHSPTVPASGCYFVRAYILSFLRAHLHYFLSGPLLGEGAAKNGVLKHPASCILASIQPPWL